MGSPLLAIFSVLPVVNAANVVLAGIIIAVCAFFSRALLHVPEWMPIPPIMMSGFQLPESIIYSSGLTVVAVTLIFCQSLLFLLRRAMLQRDWKKDDRNLTLRFINIAEYSFSIVSALALIVQAVIPVQDNVVYTFFDYVEVTDNTITHETAAACWWMAEALHWLLNFIVELCSSQLQILRRYHSFTVKFFFVTLGMVAGVLGIFVKPTLPAPQSTISLYFLLTNLCYWVSTVCFFLGYFVQSWQTAIILDHLQIRCFIFGSLRSTKHFAAPGESVVEPPSEVEMGKTMSRQSHTD